MTEVLLEVTLLTVSLIPVGGVFWALYRMLAVLVPRLCVDLLSQAEFVTLGARLLFPCVILVVGMLRMIAVGGSGAIGHMLWQMLLSCIWVSAVLHLNILAARSCLRRRCGDTSTPDTDEHGSATD